MPLQEGRTPILNGVRGDPKKKKKKKRKEKEEKKKERKKEKKTIYLPKDQVLEGAKVHILTLIASHLSSGLV